MAPKTRKIPRLRPGDARPGREGATSPDNEWTAQYTGGFDKSLRNLGIPEAQKILAQLQGFVRDLQQDTPLRGRFITPRGAVSL